MALTPASLRVDASRKCGKGYVQQGEKCHKGGGGFAASPVGKTWKEGNTLERGLLVAGGVGALAALGAGGHRVYKGYKAAKRMQEPAKSSPNDLNSVETELNSKIKDGKKAIRTVRRSTEAFAGMNAAIGVAGAGITAYGERKKDKKVATAGKAIMAISALQVANSLHGRHKAKQFEKEADVQFEEVRSKFRDYKNQHEQAANRAREREARGEGGWNNQQTTPNAAIKDPFKDLGVSSNASDAEIKAAWLKLMRANHPDAGGDPEKAKNINAAYQEILRQRRGGRRDSILASHVEIDWEALNEILWPDR